MEDLQFLKEVLSVPTKTYQEDLMVEFISKWLKERNFNFFLDDHKNIYVTKTEHEVLPDGFYFPCVVSHTDTVHTIDKINIKEEFLPNAQKELKLALKAYNDNGLPTGIGGDDKCGIFACLTLLEKLPNIKAAFFVSEETGCHGSKKADEKFFSDVGYVIEFDAPENWMISEKCSGVPLFDRGTEFFTKCDEVFCKNMDLELMEYMSNPYTDVYALRRLFNFSCINFSIGYYNYHTKNEYVVVEDVFNGIKMGEEIINSLGNNLFEKEADKTFNYYF
jgi:tripeptide aminopeptidase